MVRIVKDPDERRSELIVAAQQLFYTKGYGRTSVNDIVKAVGVAKGTFYYYFDSKTAVLEAVVASMTVRIQTVFHAIVADETLDARSKWERALRVTGSWKLERKAEIVALMRMLQQEENRLLRHKLQEETKLVTAVEFAAIIQQGVDEGVFHTERVEETAVIVVSIMTAFNDEVTALILEPARFENPVEQARRIYKAMQTVIERVLGATAGSLPIVDEAALTAWFSS